jgi:hypothetical protein
MMVAEPQKLPKRSLAGDCASSAIGGPSGRAGPIHLPWAATGSRECLGYATALRRPWRTLRGVFLSSRCQCRPAPTEEAQPPAAGDTCQAAEAVADIHNNRAAPLRAGRPDSFKPHRLSGLQITFQPWVGYSSVHDDSA